MLTKIVKPLAFAALVAGSLQVQAHRAWILPDVTVLSGENPKVAFDMAISNSIFNFDHFAMRANGLTVLSPQGKNLEPANLSTGEVRTVFDLTLEEEGTYRVFISALGMRAVWENDEGKRQFYPGRGEAFDEAKFKEILAKKPAKLEVAETSRRIETFVTSGEPTDKTLAINKKGLELKPITHPNDLFEGEEATFQFYIDGKPAEGVEISLIREGTRYRNSQEEITLTTNKKGEFKVTWPAAGRYMLEADFKDNKGKKPATQRVGKYFGVFEVLPE